VNLSNAKADWRYDKEADARHGIDVRSILTVPVHDHMGRVVAVIEAINNKRDSSFSKDEEALLQSMAVSAGTVLRKAQLYEEAITRRKQTEALLQMSELMSTELGVTRCIQKVITAGHQLVNADRIMLYMVDDKRQELVCEVGKEGFQGRRFPLGHGIAGHAALTGRIINIPNARTDWRFDPTFDQEFNFKTETVLALPVKDDLGKTVAVIEVVNKKLPGTNTIVPFTDDDETVLKSLSTAAGTVLRKAKLFEEAITRRKQMEALLQITELMSAEISTEKVMQRIIEASYALVNAERIMLYSVDPQTKDLVCVVSKDKVFHGQRIAYGQGIVGHVALTRRSLNIPEAYKDPRFDRSMDKRSSFHTRSILTVPVLDKNGACVAVIQAINKKTSDGRFTPEDCSILENMAVSAGIILHKSRLYDEAVFADRKSRALMNLVKAASVEGSLETIINGIAKVAYEALNCDRVTIYFVDQTKEEIYCVVCKDVQGWCLPLGRGIAGYVGKTGQAVNVPNAYEDERFDPSWDQKTNYKTISVLCMPIKDSNGTTIAVIQALNKKATISPPSPSTPVLSSAPAPVPGSNSGTPATPTRSTRSASVPLVSSSSPYIPLSNWSLDSGAAPENKERERRQSVNDLSPLPLTTTTSGSGLVASSAAGSNALPASIIIPFTREDEEILEAFCHEISAVVRRYQTDALLELSQIRLGKEGMLPMVEMIPRPASSPSNGTANGNGNGKLPSSLIVAQGARAAFAERWSSEYAPFPNELI